MDIYLVFSKTGTWLSNALRVILKAKYIHVSLSFDDRFDCLYSFGRTNPNNPFSGGFVIENLRKGVYKHNPKSECIIYKFKITKEQYDQLLLELDHFKKSPKKLKYNFLGLLTAGLNIRFKRKNYYFCTQFVSQVFIDAGIFNTSKQPELFRPEDILSNIKDYEQIFEGYIVNYVNNFDNKEIL